MINLFEVIADLLALKVDCATSHRLLRKLICRRQLCIYIFSFI